MQNCFLWHSYLMVIITWGFPNSSVGKKSNPPSVQETQDIQVRKILWRRTMKLMPAFLPEKSHEFQGSQRVRHNWATKQACNLIIVVHFLVILLLKFSIIFGKFWITWKWIWFKHKSSPYISIRLVRNENMLRQMISKGWISCLSFPTPWEVSSTWGRC